MGDRLREFSQWDTRDSEYCDSRERGITLVRMYWIFYTPISIVKHVIPHKETTILGQINRKTLTDSKLKN